MQHHACDRECESACPHPEPADFGKFSIVVLHAPLEDLQQKLCQHLCCLVLTLNIGASVAVSRQFPVPETCSSKSERDFRTGLAIPGTFPKSVTFELVPNASARPARPSGSSYACTCRQATEVPRQPPQRAHLARKVVDQTPRKMENATYLASTFRRATASKCRNASQPLDSG